MTGLTARGFVAELDDGLGAMALQPIGSLPVWCSPWPSVPSTWERRTAITATWCHGHATALVGYARKRP